MTENGDELESSPGSRGLEEWFPAYHPKSSTAKQALTREALVVLDANVLLDLYRYIPKTREELLNALARVGDRLWVPHQAAKEFHDRRFNAIANQERAFSDALAGMEEARKSIRRNLNQLQQSCSIPECEFAVEYEEVSRAIGLIEDKTRDQQRKVDIDIESAKSGDHLLQELTKLLKGKVGPPFTRQRLQTLYEQGERRYNEQIPPGFEDGDKPSPGKYGDLVLWEQILTEAQIRSLPVLLVSREQKRDWVRRRDAHILGPHPSLEEEFRERVGKTFHIIQPGEFLGLATGALAASVSSATFEAVNNLYPDAKSRTSKRDAETVRVLLSGIASARMHMEAVNTKLSDGQYRRERAVREKKEAAAKVKALLDSGNLGEITEEAWRESLIPLEPTEEDLEALRSQSTTAEQAYDAQRAQLAGYISQFSRSELQDILEKIDDPNALMRVRVSHVPEV
jgi:hypothetical protein